MTDTRALQAVQVVTYLTGKGVPLGSDAFAWYDARGQTLAEILRTNGGPMVVLTRVTSTPLQVEGLYKGVAYQMRTIGAPGDVPFAQFTDAEHAAFTIDGALLQIAGPTDVGGVRCLACNTVGGDPTPLIVDDSRRVHLTATYAFLVPSGL